MWDIQGKAVYYLRRLKDSALERFFNKVINFLVAHQEKILALLFVVLEIISAVLERIGKDKKSYLLAALLLSLFGFCMALCSLIHLRINPTFTPNTQLQVVEVVFSIIQLIVASIQYILTVMKVKNEYNGFAFPLAFAVIDLVFIFNIDDKKKERFKLVLPQCDSVKAVEILSGFSGVKVSIDLEGNELTITGEIDSRIARELEKIRNAEKVEDEDIEPPTKEKRLQLKPGSPPLTKPAEKPKEPGSPPLTKPAPEEKPKEKPVSLPPLTKKPKEKPVSLPLTKPAPEEKPKEKPVSLPPRTKKPKEKPVSLPLTKPAPEEKPKEKPVSLPQLTKKPKEKPVSLPLTKPAPEEKPVSLPPLTKKPKKPKEKKPKEKSKEKKPKEKKPKPKEKPRLRIIPKIKDE